ncbi:LysR family transcriptional regulator [Pseudoalteromonas luteoviolacea]|uniref:HTH lysR-type domain-containing protein n=1 Tax=Pseudoalteromonas luteoviolacea DSM 6061 TaxID=1365250 RepID=A0A166W546_9GAMM|nr:LysR family transcriptional regulator [Pseudoalteromonas luteoviolacea]KZN35734.1 hypothetical protein N475_18015 [Pseudoalteromonas luteoviolacea DSM 6061]MBE0389209.1 LysR family transcriptional regulator, transcriptional activator AphB [Pseudoalteromonas luteoviolacea DSM 6061]
MVSELSNEQLFLHVVEAGSFKSAAQRLGIDPSLVSRRIASLERRVGVKLMSRSTKRTVPTEVGEQYYQGLRRLLDEQQVLESKIIKSVEVPSGLLRVGAPHDFAIQFIVPVLAEMTTHYPSLSVDLVLASHFEDLVGQGIDVAVRVGELSDSSLICRKLGEVQRVLVASESYLASKGVPVHVDELSQHDFIFSSQTQAQKPLIIGTRTVKVQGRFAVNSVSAVKSLVQDGLGIHLGPKWAFEEEIKTGKVIQLFHDIPLKSFPLHVLYPCRDFVPAKVKIFIDNLINKCNSGSLR